MAFFVLNIVLAALVMGFGVFFGVKADRARVAGNGDAQRIFISLCIISCAAAGFVLYMMP